MGGSLQWLRAHPRLSIYLLSLVLHLALAPFLIHDWDGYVFIQTLRDFLGGTTPYQTVETEPPHIFVGDAVPVVNSWYAYPPLPLLLMTPFFAIMTLLSAEPWAARVGVKLAFILGDLLLAYVAAELVRVGLADHPFSAERRALWVERVLLLNPFLIFISAAWGMFDAWILVFLFAAILLVMKNQAALAGAAFALGCLVKPFPVFLGPLVLGFVAIRLGWRMAPRFVASGVLTASIICLPFYVSSPGGFLTQVLAMHAARPPQGFTLVGIPLAFGWITDMTGLPLPRNIQPESISQFSFMLLLGVVLLMATRLGDAKTPARLMHFSLATMLGVLLVSKVVNEQYFVLPIGLAAVALALTDEREYRRIFTAFTYGGLVSAIWLGWHFITMLPVDVARAILPVDPADVILILMQYWGWGDQEAYIYPTLIGVVALIPAAVLSFQFIGREMCQSVHRLAGHFPGTQRFPTTVGAILVVALMMVPLSVGVYAARGFDAVTTDEPLNVEGPLVGTYYYLWWSNPARDPKVEFGNWQKGVSQVPEAGYYTSTAGKIRSDFQLMRESGIDLALLSYHEYDKPKMPAAVRLAYESGLLIAPMIELSDLYYRNEHRVLEAGASRSIHLPRELEAADTVGSVHLGMSLRNETRDAVVEFTSGALNYTAKAPAAWRIDNKPVVVFFDSYFMSHDAAGEVRERMEEVALDHLANNSRLLPASATRERLLASFPISAAELTGHGPYAGVWRAAYGEVYRTFWLEVRAELEARHGPLYFMSGETWDPEQPPHRGVETGIAALDVHNASYVYAPSFTWVFHQNDSYEQNYGRWHRNHVVKSQFDRGAGQPVIVSLAAGYDDRALRGEKGFVIPHDHNGRTTYSRMWEDALAQHPDVVLVASWNEFYEGTGIEPTREHGRSYLDQTREWSQRLKGQAEETSPRILLVTNLLGDGWLPGPVHWTFNFTVRLQLAAQQLWGAQVHAVEWHSALLDASQLAAYDVVIVDPGAGASLSASSDNFPAHLDAYARGGGTVLLLGSGIGDFSSIASHEEGRRLGGATLLHPDGLHIPLVANDHLRVVTVPDHGDVRLLMTEDTAATPALWVVESGSGRIAVTAFHPAATVAVTDAVVALRAVADAVLENP